MTKKITKAITPSAMSADRANINRKRVSTDPA
jgi:hypothetical protein